MPSAGIGLTVALFLTAIIPALFDLDDERYTAISVVYVVFIVTVTGMLALRQSKAVAESRVPAGDLHPAPTALSPIDRVEGYGRS